MSSIGPVGPPAVRAAGTRSEGTDDGGPAGAFAAALGMALPQSERVAAPAGVRGEPGAACAANQAPVEDTAATADAKAGTLAGAIVRGVLVRAADAALTAAQAAKAALARAASLSSSSAVAARAVASPGAEAKRAISPGEPATPATSESRLAAAAASSAATAADGAALVTHASGTPLARPFHPAPVSTPAASSKPVRDDVAALPVASRSAASQSPPAGGTSRALSTTAATPAAAAGRVPVQPIAATAPGISSPANGAALPASAASQAAPVVATPRDPAPAPVATATNTIEAADAWSEAAGRSAKLLSMKLASSRAAAANDRLAPSDAGEAVSSASLAPTPAARSYDPIAARPGAAPEMKLPATDVAPAAGSAAPAAPAAEGATPIVAASANGAARESEAPSVPARGATNREPGDETGSAPRPIEEVRRAPAAAAPARTARRATSEASVHATATSGPLSDAASAAEISAAPVMARHDVAAPALQAAAEPRLAAADEPHATPVTHALEDAPATQPHGTDRVTVSYVGEDGAAGRIRLSVRGDALRATIVTDQAGAAGRLTEDLGALRRGLAEHGFSDLQLNVQSTSRPAASERAGSEHRPGDDRERRAGSQDSSNRRARQRTPRDSAER